MDIVDRKGIQGIYESRQGPLYIQVSLPEQWILRGMGRLFRFQGEVSLVLFASGTDGLSSFIAGRRNHAPQTYAQVVHGKAAKA